MMSRKPANAGGQHGVEEPGGGQREGARGVMGLMCDRMDDKENRS